METQAVKLAAAMPLPKLAATPTSGLFMTDHEPRGGFVDVDTIAKPLLPEHSRPRLRDPIPDAVKILWDLAAEGIQLLENAELILPDHEHSGNTVSSATTARAPARPHSSMERSNSS